MLDIGLTSAGAKAAVDGTEWDRHIAAWVDEQRLAGRMTTVRQACAMLVRLAEGEADNLTGRYVTVDDDLPALLAARRPGATQAS